MIDHWFLHLAASPWLSLLANIGQVASIVIVVALWRYHLCRVPWCLRPGAVRAGRTAWKLCPHHHTDTHVRHVLERHAAKHPDAIR